MSEDRTTVVVLERGGAWPSCLSDCRRDTPNTIVIAQDAHEHVAMLARRAEARLARLVAEGRPIDAAVMVFSDDRTGISAPGSAPTDAGRAHLAGALLERLLERSGHAGTLWLVAPEGATEALRHQIFALAGSLTARLGESEVTIAVRFGEGQRLPPRRTRSGLQSLPAELAV